MTRSPCVVGVGDLEPEDRPRRLNVEGVRSRLRGVSDAVGLQRMGVSIREIDPGMAGTARHFHDVEEEWVYVLSGTGSVRLGAHTLDVRAGTFVGFAPGPVPHHFLATGTEPLVLLEGGERRRTEETVWYPDLGLLARRGKLEKTTELPTLEEGDRDRRIHIDDLRIRDFQHPVDAGSRRKLRSLHTEVGLTRQAVRWSRVSVRDRTTAYHTHTRTDEWVYILDGRAEARVGDERFEVGPGDFLGHPAGGPPHVMQPRTDLTYLMGGQIDPEDVVLYPEAGKRLYRDRIEPLS